MFSSLRVTHPAVMGFDFTVIAPLLSSHCGVSFVFAWKMNPLPSFIAEFIGKIILGGP